MRLSKTPRNVDKDLPAAGPKAYQLDGDLWVKRITLSCAICALLVGAADLCLVYFDLSPSTIMARSFDITREESLCTWFSSAQALLAGLVAAAIGVHSRKHDSTFVMLGWTIVALFFIYVSLDDTAKLHERLGTTLRVKSEQITDVPLSDWFPSWGWQLFIAPVFMAMGVFILFFLWRVVAVGLRLWVLVALGLLGFAVALDFIEGLELEALSSYSSTHLTQLLEEVVEMLGTTTFLFIFLSTLNSRIRLQIFDSYG